MAGEGGGSLPPLRRRTRRDRVVLAVVDGVLIFAAFAIVFAAFGRFDAMGVVLNSLGAAAIGLLAMHVEGLWLERIIAVRWLELAKLTRLAAVLFVGALILDRVPGSPITLLSAAVAGAVSWLLLVVWRSVYRSWLRVRRQRGRDFQRVLVVGSDQRVLDVVRTFAIHPEAGMHVVGLVGSQAAARAAGLDELWLGELSDLAAVLARTPTDCAIVGPTHEVGTESARPPPADGDRRVLGPGPRRHRRAAHLGDGVRQRAADPCRSRRAVAACLGDQAHVRRPRLLAAPRADVPAVRRHRRGDQGHRSRPGAVQAAARRTGRAGVRGAQVPHDGRRRRSAIGRAASGQRPFGTAVQDGRRSAGHACRSFLAGDQPRRAAPADQRGARRHEPRRTAPGAAARGRAVPRHPPPASWRAAGHHRLVAGRGAGQPVVRRL